MNGKSFGVISEPAGDGSWLLGENPWPIAVTLTVTVTGSNLSLQDSQGEVLEETSVHVLEAHTGQQTLVYISALSADYPWEFNFTFEGFQGSSHAAHNDQERYMWPFSARSVMYISHGCFEVDAGTSILCSRDGEVLGIRDASSDKPPYVWVAHDDGSVAVYKNVIPAVQLSSVVTKGEIIGHASDISLLKFVVKVPHGYPEKWPVVTNIQFVGNVAPVIGRLYPFAPLAAAGPQGRVPMKVKVKHKHKHKHKGKGTGKGKGKGKGKGGAHSGPPPKMLVEDVPFAKSFNPNAGPPPAVNRTSKRLSVGPPVNRPVQKNAPPKLDRSSKRLSTGPPVVPPAVERSAPPPPVHRNVPPKIDRSKRMSQGPPPIDRSKRMSQGPPPPIDRAHKAVPPPSVNRAPPQLDRSSKAPVVSRSSKRASLHVDVNGDIGAQVGAQAEDYAKEAGANAAQNRKVQQAAGDAVSRGANNRQAQQAAGNTIASNTDNALAKKVAKSSFAQKLAGKAVGSAAKNERVQKQTGNMVAQQIRAAPPAVNRGSAPPPVDRGGKKPAPPPPVNRGSRVAPAPPGMHSMTPKQSHSAQQPQQQQVEQEDDGFNDSMKPGYRQEHKTKDELKRMKHKLPGNAIEKKKRMAGRNAESSFRNMKNSLF